MISAVADNVRVEQDGHILRITLARPGARNALNAATLAELTAAFSDVGNARVVLLAGDGASFCAGADVEELKGATARTGDDVRHEAAALVGMLVAVNECPVPVVCRVQGHAFGGGAGLVGASDIVVAHEDTQFGFSEVKLGIAPSSILPFVVPKIGIGNARRYLLSGERFDGREAKRIGLVHEAATDLDGVVAKILDEFRSTAPLATRESKRLLRERVFELSPDDVIARAALTDEGQEGMRSFLERRKPDWDLS
jgi:methylglutaconyl-CoA hydratase